MDDPLLLIRVLLLLGIANGTPIFAKKLLNDRFAAPLDGGLTLRDGRSLFGRSKTIRGLAVAIVCTALAAPLLGFGWALGAGLATASLVGDLASSFTKRRLGLAPHAQAFLLDQIPEALLPLLLFQAQLGLSALDIALLLAAFVGLEIVLSRLLFKLHIRDRPY
ncbi:MAG: CDP-archaeol synthase [Burkholderiales bacterium]